VDCLHATPKYVPDGEFPAIRTADIEPGKIRLSQARRLSARQFSIWTSRLAPQESDILYSREGERFGIAALVPTGVRLCISQRMMVFRIKPSQISEFLMWQLNCKHVVAQASCDIIGSTAPHVNVEQIKNYRLVAPPKGEQQQIVAFIAKECRGFDAALARTEREISLLREYRTRLTSDVVAGKLDVREAASKLPTESFTLETTSDLAESLELEPEEIGV
jgi:type I restriction enzyme S subunit